MTHQTQTLEIIVAPPDDAIYIARPTFTPEEPDPSLPFAFLYAHSFGHHQRAAWQILWDEAIARWLYTGRRRSDKTRRAYTESLTIWRRYLTDQCAIYHIWQATDREAAAWLRTLADAGAAPRTIALRAAAVSSLYLYAKSTRTLHAGREISLFIDAHGGSRDNPFSSANVNRPAVEQYSDSERVPNDAYKWILSHLNHSPRTPATLRNKALLLAFGFTGWRADEVLSMTWGRIQPNSDHPGQYTYRWTGKARNGEFETRPLPALVFDAIHAYLLAAGRPTPDDDDFIFRPTVTAPCMNFPNVHALAQNRHIAQSTCNDLLKRLLTAYALHRSAARGLPRDQALPAARKYAARFSIHSLRHMFAHNLYLSTNHDIRYVSGRLGHKNVATTMKYLKSLEKPVDDYSDALAIQLGLGLA